jgi:hypothetical protein
MRQRSIYSQVKALKLLTFKTAGRDKPALLFYKRKRLWDAVPIPISVKKNDDTKTHRSFLSAF